jgi:hypothetical protein
MKTDSRAHRTIDRVKQIWAELDYAQRRLLEVRTGVSLPQSSRQGSRARVTRPRRHGEHAESL